MTSNEFLKYDFVKIVFHNKLESLEHLNEVLPALYSEYFQSESEKLKQISIPESDFAVIKNIIEMMASNDDGMVKEMEKLSSGSLKVLGNSVGRLRKKHTTNEFLRQMTITYLITVFEDFLKTTLKLAYYYKREALISEEVLKYKEIIELKTYDAIIESMIEEKAKKIINKPIKDLGETLEKDFHFPLINDTEWKKFAEVFYRRHAIVHNNGLPDEDYKLKTGDSTITDITPTSDYIKQSLELFKQYSNKIYDFFNQKYPVITV